MKLKQLQVLKDQHKGYLARISKTDVKEPDATCHIVHALVRGENLPIQSSQEISAKARDRVASCSGYSSDRNLGFSNIFQVPASFKKAERGFLSAQKSQQVIAGKYQKEADSLLLRAELNDTLDPEDVSSELRMVAIKHGLDA